MLDTHRAVSEVFAHALKHGQNTHSMFFSADDYPLKLTQTERATFDMVYDHIITSVQFLLQMADNRLSASPYLAKGKKIIGWNWYVDRTLKAHSGKVWFGVSFKRDSGLAGSYTLRLYVWFQTQMAQRVDAVLQAAGINPVESSSQSRHVFKKELAQGEAFEEIADWVASRAQELLPRLSKM